MTLRFIHAADLHLDSPFRGIRCGSSCAHSNCCRRRNAPAMPARRWKSWKDWTASSACATRHIIATQEAPPDPVFLRNGHQPPAVPPVAPIGVNHWDEHWTAHLAPLAASQEPEADQPDFTGGEVAAAPPATVAPRKPTFLQKERWKAVQKARRKGMSPRTIERELRIHRATIRSCLEAGGPPRRKQRMVPNPSTSDTMAA